MKKRKAREFYFVEDKTRTWCVFEFKNYALETLKNLNKYRPDVGAIRVIKVREVINKKRPKK